jgi:hypothetical protein
MSISDCKMLEFPKIMDCRGNLTFIEGNNHLPFDIRRIYYLYDLPGNAERGGHAHHQLRQVIVAVSGSFDIVLDDGFEKKRIHLNRPYLGFFMETKIWRELDNFSPDAVCLVLASDVYKVKDYIRDYSEFLKIANKRNL